MAYTREQLNEAIQTQNDLGKKHSAQIVRKALVLGIATGIVACTGAFAGLALSYVILSPIIAGGIIGSAVPLVWFIINACCSFKGNVLSKSTEKYLSEEHKQILREYSNSTEYKVKTYIGGVAEIAVSFGIGAGLVALGLTSPAAIGAVTLLAALAVLYPLGSLIDKAIECFFPEGSGKQPDSLVSDMKVDGADKNHSTEQPQHVVSLGTA